MYKLPCQNSGLFQFWFELVASCRLGLSAVLTVLEKPVSKENTTKCWEMYVTVRSRIAHQQIANLAKETRKEIQKKTKNTFV